MKWYIKVLKQYADFEGRASKKEFWMFVLFNFIFSILALLVSAMASALAKDLSYGVFYYLYIGAMFLPGMAVTVRRLHDVGKSGWFLLIGLIPVIGGIWLLALMVMNSKYGRNRYGENPKESDYSSNFDRDRSMAVTLIIASCIWLIGELTRFIRLYQNTFHAENFPGLINMLFFVAPLGLMIAGFSILQKRKLTNTVAYSFIIVSIIWIFLRIYFFVPVFMNYSLILSYLVLIVPVTLFILGISILGKKVNKETVKMLLIIGVGIWALQVINSATFAFGFLQNPSSSYGLNSFTNLLDFVCSIMMILMPVSLLLLATSLRTESSLNQRENTPLPSPKTKTLPSDGEEPIPEPEEKVYYERDNRGMRVNTFSQSQSYWIVERFRSSRNDPFVYYTFMDENDAKMAMLELPFIHLASDSGKLICDDIFRFGYFAITNDGKLTGEYDAFIAGADFTHDMWSITHKVFTKYKGVKKNDLEPNENVKSNSLANGNAKNVSFVRENTNGSSVWRVHKAPNKADAIAFLAQQQIRRSLYYIVVETPHGNFGKDIDGFYQE